jgi:hypothetical protein
MHAPAWLTWVDFLQQFLSLVLGMLQGVQEGTFDDQDLMVEAQICWIKESMELVGFCTQGV